MAEKKFALVAFNDDPVCFVHVLLNAIDLADKGSEVKIIMEGRATTLIPELEKEGDTPSHKLYKVAKKRGLLDSACRACSHQLGVLKEVEAHNIRLRDDMSGHPSFSQFLLDGYQVITF